MTDAAGKPVDQVTLEAPLLTALAPGQKRRFVPFALIPDYMKKAVLAIEDQRFYTHPGVDPIRMVGALISNLRGNKKYLEGASTISQQIIKNTFLTPAQTPKRKLQEQFMALVLDSRFTKDQILELYLNEVVSSRGPFAIHGVGEASRIFFGKDVGTSPRRSRDDCRPHPAAVGAESIRIRVRQGASQRGAHRNGPRRLHHGGRGQRSGAAALKVERRALEDRRPTSWTTSAS